MGAKRYVIAIAIGILLFVPTWILIILTGVPLQLILFSSLGPKSEAVCYKNPQEINDTFDCIEIQQQNAALASARQSGIMNIGGFARSLELAFVGLAGFLTVVLVDRWKMPTDMRFGLISSLLFSLIASPLTALSILLALSTGWTLVIAALVEGAAYLLMNAVAFYSGFAIAKTRQKTKKS